MDPLTITIVLNSIAFFTEEVEKQNQARDIRLIKESLHRIENKQDQQITREIHAAFEALEDAQKTSSPETRQSRLDFAEERLLVNTHLDPKLVTAGEVNAYWMAVAHLGLGIVSRLKSDRETAAAHILKVFRASPRHARESLLPQFWQEHFKPRCGDLFRRHQRELRELAATSVEERERKSEATQAASKVAGISLLVTSGTWTGALAYKAAKKLKKTESTGDDNSSSFFRKIESGVEAVGKKIDQQRERWVDASVAKSHDKAAARLSEELEEKIDERCRTLSEELLAGKVSLETSPVSLPPLPPDAR